MPTRVRALEERIACDITFPRLTGYRYEIPSRRLSAAFSEASQYALSTADIPTKTENRPIVGEGSIHTLDDLKTRRDAEVAFLLAKLTLEKYFRQDGEARADRPTEHRFDAEVQAWLFPQVLAITRRWLAECVTCKDNTFPQLLLLIEFAHDAADRIYKAIVASAEGTPALRPQLRPYDVMGSTRYVDFDTTKSVYPTDPARSHVSHVVADTGSWEQKLAQSLEEMPEIDCYVKNQGLNFTIPYTLNGDDRQYFPDFIARSGDLHLIIEVSGEARKDKAAKVSTARTLWVPAVNNHGGFGRWAFVEVTDPWDAQRTIRAAIVASGAAAAAHA
jgi:type III restriction enzyme